MKKNNLKKWVKKQQHILFPFLDVALNGFNYIYHIYTSWYIIPLAYGELNALLSISAILFVFGISFQTLAAKFVSENQGDKQQIIKLMKAGVLFAVLLDIIILIASPLLAALTRSTFPAILIVALTFSVNMVLSIVRGISQGRSEFFNLNISFYIEVLTKMALLFIFLPRFPNIYTSLLTVFAGMCMSLFHGIRVNRDFLDLSACQCSRKEILSIFKTISSIFIANFFLYFFTSFDMIAVNYFIPERSGVFAVVLKYCQLIIYVSFSLITVFIPYIGKNKKDNEKLKKNLKLSFLLVGGICVVSMISFRTFVPLTVPMFFDDAYAAAADFLFLGSIPYSFLVMGYLTVNLNILLDRKKQINLMMYSAIILLGLLVFFHSTIVQIFVVEIIAFSFLFVILLTDFYKHNRELFSKEGQL